jgi:hypothetical protein
VNPGLVLGPLLRYAGETDATVWVETDGPCEVEVLGCAASTFEVEGHHYALVLITGLEPGGTHEYAVSLDGTEVWPEPGDIFPAPVIRTSPAGKKLDLAFGSCRVSVPHEPPYTKRRGIMIRGGASGRRFERDALYALAARMLEGSQQEWPDALLLLGDQIYADEVSMGTAEFIRSRRDTSNPPGEDVADFQEYCRLYWDAWKEPRIRWLLSTVPTAMIFDDHDVNDDWNSSEAWVREMRSKPWWEERIVGAFTSYWIYQHLGNLSPDGLEEDEIYGQIGEKTDATRLLREFAYRADREIEGTRWSYYRDFGRTRLIVADSRAGRVLAEGSRAMLDAQEWDWVREKATGEFDHLLIGTSMPFLLSPGFHHLESWNAAVCAGAWGRRAARLGESIRQLVDLEHWAAFHDSFEDLADLLRSVAAGKLSTGRPPASVVVLSGDVHHGYLAKAQLDRDIEASVYQAVGSPLRNPLGTPERIVMRASWSKLAERIGSRLAGLAGVPRPSLRWRLLHDEPWFDNHISTLMLRGRRAEIKVEKTSPEDTGEPILSPILRRTLA